MEQVCRGGGVVGCVLLGKRDMLVRLAVWFSHRGVVSGGVCVLSYLAFQPTNVTFKCLNRPVGFIKITVSVN